MNSESQNQAYKLEPLITSINTDENWMKEEVKTPQWMTQLQWNIPKNQYLDKNDTNIWYDSTLSPPTHKPDYYIVQEISVKSEPNNPDITYVIPVEDSNNIPKEKEYSPVPNKFSQQQVAQQNEENYEDPKWLDNCWFYTWFWCYWPCYFFHIIHDW